MKTCWYTIEKILEGLVVKKLHPTSQLINLLIVQALMRSLPFYILPLIREMTFKNLNPLKRARFMFHEK